MDGDDFVFPGFSFGQFNIFEELLLFEIINVLSGEGEQVADAQCGVGTENDEDVVPKLILLQKIFR